MPHKNPAVRSEYLKKYQREWVRRRRAEWLSANGPCPCGSRDRLEIDHVDPSQKVSHRIWSWSAGKREAELAKCRVLCRDCHQRRHTEEANARRSHGTYGMYRFGCRCVDCKFANSIYRAGIKLPSAKFSPLPAHHHVLARGVA